MGAGAAFIGIAHGNTLLDETNLVAASGIAAGSEFSFNASTAQALTVTLTDIQTPAAFQSLQIAVTLGDALVGTASVDGTTGVTSATINLPAATGNYEFHVIGTPTNLGFGSFGSFSVCTAPQATPTACIAADSYSDNIQTPSAAATSNVSLLNTNFTSTVAGAYAVSLLDDQFPAALQTQLTVAGIAQGSTQISGPINPSATPTQVTLAAGTQYSLLVAATASATVQAGLYSIQITDPNGIVVFARTLPVGELASSTIVSNPSPQSLSLTLADLAYPAALNGLGVAVTSGAGLLGDLTASGNTMITAPSGNLEVWQYAVAGGQPGAYTLSLASGTASLLSTTQVVNPSNASTANSFAFVATLPASGTYNLLVTDYQFPTILGSLTYTVAQNSTTIPVNSSGDFTAAAAGTVIVVVDATPANNGVGIFGVTLSTTGAMPTTLLDQTQAVGGVFSTTTINLGASGEYDVTLADLAFPATFADLAVIVTENSQVFGKIYGGGSFPIAMTPGQYVVTFVAAPGAQKYGLYSLNISSAPPTVTLNVSPTTVPAGQSVQVSWSSSGATSCTASGTSAFIGNEPLSSMGLAVAIPATVTLSLTCVGPGGSATSQPVTVTATAAASTSGGGAMDLYCLLMLMALAVATNTHSRQFWMTRVRRRNG
jgi:hypothetical protein